VIFISYSWHDRDVVDRLISRLREHKVAYWIDSENLDLDQSLKGQIFQGLRRATTLLLIDSAPSRESRWVRFEMQAALVLGRPIVAPVAVGPPADCRTCWEVGVLKLNTGPRALSRTE
jgi:hypothetical protein